MGWGVLISFAGEKPFLAGRYYWGLPVTRHQNGHRISLFLTRSDAREYARRCNYARAVRVQVKVRIVK